MYPCAGDIHLCHCEGVGYQSICGGLGHQEMMMCWADGQGVGGLCVLPSY